MRRVILQTRPALEDGARVLVVHVVLTPRRHLLPRNGIEGLLRPDRGVFRLDAIARLVEHGAAEGRAVVVNL